MAAKQLAPQDPGPATDAIAITAGSAFPAGYTTVRSLYVGGAGTVVATSLAGNQATWLNVPAGTFILCGFASVDSGTTATGILGLV